MKKYKDILTYLFNIIWIIPLSFYLSINQSNTIKIQIDTIYENKIGTHDTQIFFSTDDNDYSEKQSIINPILLRKNFDFIENTFNVNSSMSINKIRFDPINTPDTKMIIKHIKIIDGAKIYPLNLSAMCVSKDILPLASIKEFQCKDDISFVTTGNDAHIQIFKNFKDTFLNIRSKELIVSTFVLTLLLLMILFIVLRVKRVRNLLFYSINCLHIKHSQQIFSISFIFLIVSIILIKSFVMLMDIFYYQKKYEFYDIVMTYTQDILLSTMLGLIGLSILFLDYIIELKSYKVSNLLLSYVLKSIKFIFHFFILALSSLIFIFSFYYLISGYIFSEWGAFIESKHLIALKHHGGGEEVVALFFQIKTYIFLFLVLLIVVLSYKLSIFLKKHKPKKTLFYSVLLLLLFTALSYFPISHIYKSKPSTESPVILLAQGLEDNTEGAPPELIEKIAINDFNPLTRLSTIPSKYEKFHSIAKDFNIIFYVMESARKKNIPIYGYARDTMPFLSIMAKNSLVFDNAFVNQPRSCKTMASLNLGIYPDPKSSAITWHYDKIKQPGNSLFGILDDNNYSLYFGTLQEDYGGDNFDKFMNTTSNFHITLEDLDSFHNQEMSRLDEQQLTNGFLNWTLKQNKKFAALLWTKSAHMPYSSPYKKFEEKTKLDMYDNSLVNIDNSLKNLVQGLKKQDKLKNTLIVIFGDHGEAIEDKMDWGHGNFLYDHSLRIPFLIYNEELFKYTLLKQRFQIKDIANTIFYLLGINQNLNQSINIFKKSSNDKIYLSNVYQDFKLGLVFNHYKFVYRPKYDFTYLYDLKNDPDENHNIIDSVSDDIEKLKEETLQWYKYQLNYLNKNILIQENQRF